MPGRPSGVPAEVSAPQRPKHANDAAAQASLALSNMRGLVILTVLAFHSVLAYLGSQGPHAFAFDTPPYEWRAFPIVDSHRWYGFDLFCAWQDVYLMSLMFFLSALFTWPSLRRKGTWTFLTDRYLGIGVPFVFALAVIVPIAVYPAYRVTAGDPSLAGYAAHWLALPFWPNGPMWFLWQLLALASLAALLHRFAPNWIDALGRLSSVAAAHPGRYFVCLAAVSALAYVPLALIWTPWVWSDNGPFAIQLSRPLHYAVYFFAGLGIGAYGYERGLLAPSGALARGWAAWLALALGFLALWMALTSASMSYGAGAPFLLQVAVGASFTLACAAGGFCVMAICLRFGTRRSRILDSLSGRSFGLYLVHYVYVVWLQYALLDLDLPAVFKAATVFGGTLVLSWTTVTALRFVPFGQLLLGAGRHGAARPPANVHRPAAPDFQLPNAVR